MEYLEVKCLNVCKLLSNGSAKTNKPTNKTPFLLIYIWAKREGSRKIKQMWQVLTDESR